MTLSLITVTQDNISWAVNENWKRVFDELAFKVPVNGVAKLEADIDMSGFQVYGIKVSGPNAAQPEDGGGPPEPTETFIRWTVASFDAGQQNKLYTGETVVTSEGTGGYPTIGTPASLVGQVFTSYVAFLAAFKAIWPEGVNSVFQSGNSEFAGQQIYTYVLDDSVAGLVDADPETYFPFITDTNFAISSWPLLEVPPEAGKVRYLAGPYLGTPTYTSYGPLITSTDGFNIYYSFAPRYCLYAELVILP